MIEVVKPSWVKHHDDRDKRQCIFSADIDGEGRRLATGGMDGVIRVWRLASLFDKQAGPVLLSSMNRHGGSVLSVRWACNGLLASSSDDCSVLVWQLDSRPGGFRGNIEALGESGPIEETYKVVKRLIGHQSGTVGCLAASLVFTLLDTVGVEWSPDGSLLASCGLDGAIFIWNAAPSSAQTVLARLEHAHGGFIKGLAWDPAGQYLTSQSDDGICNIWNVKSILEAVRASASSSVSFDCSEEQECEAIKVVALEDVFHRASKMTFFHRPSWSPDGSMLALANASNRQIPVVALVERANWRGNGMSFVGHDAPIEVVRFCPRLMRLVDAENERSEVICAVAGQDGQLSVWTSCQTTPLLVISDAFDHTVMDLAWSPDGRILIAASYDGSIVGVSFGELQLDDGKVLVPLADELQRTRLQEALSGLRAKSADEDASASGYLHHQAIIAQVKENDTFLANQPVESSLSESVKEEIGRPLRVQTVEPVPQSPIVSVTKDGRKRITPQLLMQAAPMPSSLESGQEAGSVKPRMQSSAWQRWREEDYIAQRRFLDKASALLVPHLLSGPLFSLKNLGDAEPATLVHQLAGDHGAQTMLPSISMQISNVSIGDRKASAVISLVEGSQVAWKERCKGTVYLASGNVEYSVLAVKSGESRHELMFLSRTGRRILPLIALASRVVRFVTRDEFCLVLTACGGVHLWNVSGARLLISDGNLGSVLKAGGSVASLDFGWSNDAGSVKLEVFVGGCLQQAVYDSLMGTWMTANDASRADRPARAGDALLARIKAAALAQGDLLVGESQLADLEFRLATAYVMLRNGRELESSGTFERTVALYALKLAREGRCSKALEFLDDLKALKQDRLLEQLVLPIYCQANSSEMWQDCVSRLLS